MDGSPWCWSFIFSSCAAPAAYNVGCTHASVSSPPRSSTRAASCRTQPPKTAPWCLASPGPIQRYTAPQAASLLAPVPLGLLHVHSSYATWRPGPALGCRTGCSPACTQPDNCPCTRCLCTVGNVQACMISRYMMKAHNRHSTMCTCTH